MLDNLIIFLTSWSSAVGLLGMVCMVLGPQVNKNYIKNVNTADDNKIPQPWPKKLNQKTFDNRRYKRNLRDMQRLLNRM